MFEYFIGIDPGVNGAVTVMRPNGDVVHCEDVPTIKNKNRKTIDTRALAAKLNLVVGDADAFACIEKVHAMPQQGVSSTFAFGRAFGQLEGLVSAFGWALIHVRPKEWQKKYLFGAKDTKEKSREVASNLFPSVDLSLKKHHNKADSLLVADYGRRFQNLEGS